MKAGLFSFIESFELDDLVEIMAYSGYLDCKNCLAKEFCSRVRKEKIAETTKQYVEQFGDTYDVTNYDSFEEFIEDIVLNEDYDAPAGFCGYILKRYFQIGKEVTLNG